MLKIEKIYLSSICQMVAIMSADKISYEASVV